MKVRRKLIELDECLYEFLDDDFTIFAFHKTSLLSSLFRYISRKNQHSVRLILFLSLVDAPENSNEIKNLFNLARRICRDQVSEEDIKTARSLIEKSWKNYLSDNNLDLSTPLPKVYDPFCGGGTTLIEAERLGVPAIGSDIDPYALSVSQSMYSISLLDFSNIKTKIISFIRKLEEKTAHLYPPFKITKHHVSLYKDLENHIGEVIKPEIFIWARTIKSPFFEGETPLLKEIYLGSDHLNRHVHFFPFYENQRLRFKLIFSQKRYKSPFYVGRKKFLCVFTKKQIPEKFLTASNMSYKLAAVFFRKNQKLYFLPVDEAYENVCTKNFSNDDFDCEFKTKTLEYQKSARANHYGFCNIKHFFLERQKCFLSEFLSLIQEEKDASFKALLASVFIKYLNFQTTFSTFSFKNLNKVPIFITIFIFLPWPVFEIHPYDKSPAQVFKKTILHAKNLPKVSSNEKHVFFADATKQTLGKNTIFSTDPPYGDMVTYSAMNEFFAFFMKRIFEKDYPEFFSNERYYEHDLSMRPQEDFRKSMELFLERCAEQQHPAYPATLWFSYFKLDNGFWFSALKSMLKFFKIESFVFLETSNSMKGHLKNVSRRSFCFVLRRKENLPLSNKAEMHNVFTQIKEEPFFKRNFIRLEKEQFFLIKATSIFSKRNFIDYNFDEFWADALSELKKL